MSQNSACFQTTALPPKRAGGGSRAVRNPAGDRVAPTDSAHPPLTDLLDQIHGELSAGQAAAPGRSLQSRPPGDLSLGQNHSSLLLANPKILACNQSCSVSRGLWQS